MINPAKAYTIEEYIEILRRRIWFIIVPFVLVLTGASVYAIAAPRQYKASTVILVSPQRVPEAYVQATVTSKVEERLQAIAQEVLSRTRLEQIIAEQRLYQKEQKSMSREEVVARMQKDIKIELPTKKEEKKGYFAISYLGRDPVVAATVANRLASQFIEENLKIREQQAVGTTEFLAVEVAAAKAKLDELEAAVTQYKQRFMGELPEQRDTNIRILEQVQNQYQRVGESLRAAQDRKLFLQKQLSDIEHASGSPGAAAYDVPNGSAKSLTGQKDVAAGSAAGGGGSYGAQKEALLRALADLRLKYTENHPDVVIVRKKLADLEKNRDSMTGPTSIYNIKNDPTYREIKKQLDMTDLEIRRLGDEERGVANQIGKYRARIEQAPAREQDMASLMREYSTSKESYEKLLQKSQEAQQAENLEKRQKGEQFRIVDPARVPEKPDSPDIPKIFLIALLAGLGGGFGLAFFREQMDRSFHDSGDVEVALGLKVLATVPKLEGITH
jgi:polysaccharide chain length determinant protein (PEP-CTERM system associated)